MPRLPSHTHLHLQRPSHQLLLGDISFLILLFERTGTGEDELVEVAMSRQDMADYLGLTIETVCRILGKFKRSRVIDIPNLHQLVLRDIDALYALAEGGE